MESEARPPFAGQTLLDALEADLGNAKNNSDEQISLEDTHRLLREQVLYPINSKFKRKTKPEPSHYGELTKEWCLPAVVGAHRKQKVRAHEKKVNPPNGSEPLIWRGSAWFRGARKAVTFDDISKILCEVFFSAGPEMPPSRKYMKQIAAAQYDGIPPKDVLTFVNIAAPYWKHYHSIAAQLMAKRESSNSPRIHSDGGEALLDRKSGEGVAQGGALAGINSRQKMPLRAAAPAFEPHVSSQPPGATNDPVCPNAEVPPFGPSLGTKSASGLNPVAHPPKKTLCWAASPGFTGNLAPESSLAFRPAPKRLANFATRSVNGDLHGMLFGQSTPRLNNQMSPLQDVQHIHQPAMAIHGFVRGSQPDLSLRKANIKVPIQPSKSDPSRSRGRHHDVAANSVSIGLPRPAPSFPYYQCASTPPVRLSSPQQLLLISDLNGTLIVRPRRQLNFKRRPGLTSFLESVFGRHNVMIWTSSRPETTNQILPKLLTPEQFGKCVAIWARDTLGLTKTQYINKTQVYKKLGNVWANEAIQSTHPQYTEGGRWDQSNTLLIDDSLMKAAAQPYNLINVPELTVETIGWEIKMSVLAQVAGYIEEAQWWSNVSAFAKQNAFKVGEGWECKARTMPNLPRAGTGVDEPEIPIS